MNLVDQLEKTVLSLPNDSKTLQTLIYFQARKVEILPKLSQRTQKISFIKKRKGYNKVVQN